MSELLHRMGRFSWSMWLFGARQAEEMLSALGAARPPRRATAAFDTASRTAGEGLRGGLRDAYSAGDRWQAQAVDVACRMTAPAVDAARSVASTTLVRGGLEMLQHGSGLAEAMVPEQQRAMWRELANKLAAFEDFRYADQILELGGREELARLVGEASRKGSWRRLWLLEAIGYLAAEAAWDRDGAPAGLLRRDSVDSLPRSSWLALHTGMGLGLARRCLPEIEAAGDGLAAALERFAALCEDNARPGYALASYEALGLIVRQLAPDLVGDVDRELLRRDETRAATFWHGVGRGLYFVASQAFPGSLGRAVEKARREPTHELGQRNALSGLAWALTLVNLRHPRVLELFLRAGAPWQAEEELAAADGVVSAAVLWRDAGGDGRVVDRLCEHRPEAAEAAAHWRRLVQSPVTEAAGVEDALRAGPGLGAMFRYRGRA